MSRRTSIAAVCVALSTTLAAQDQAPGPRPIVVQGAMRLETERLIGRLRNVTTERAGGWSFWRGTLDGYPVIVSRTLMGVANGAVATALAAERYHPIAILNQGTAGGHHAAMKNFDVVLGASAVSIGGYKSPLRKKGAGSNAFEWQPIDVRGTAESGGEDLKEGTFARFPADAALLAAARSVRSGYTRGRVVEGVIGSSDIWHEEVDLLARFHTLYGTDVEEFETASAAQTASLFGIPFLGIRIVTANVTNGSAYDAKTAEACQDFVYEVVKAYIRTLKP